MAEHKVLVNTHFKGRPGEQLFLALFWAPSPFQMLSGIFLSPIASPLSYMYDILNRIAIE